MKKILYSTMYSFKEIKNSKIFYSFLIFALILISGSYFVSQTSFISQGRIMVDFSIFAITIFNIFIGIFIGSSIVYDDIEKKSIFLSITRPVKRTEYLIGRFLGLTAAIIFSTVIMMLIFYFVLLIMHKYVIPLKPFAGQPTIYSLPQPLIIQALFIIIESVFIAAVALLFSLITSKALASIFTILVFFIGNVSSKMNDLVRPVKKIIGGKIVIVHQANHALTNIVHIIYAILPNFSIFNISSEAAYKIFISAGTVFYRIVYGLSYMVLLFIISSLIFTRKDIS
ncbi:MAG: ABC transporter permease subunit [Deltaproteobacteria bacterium]|nr:ABC transporter permease [Deltaproteobacteria bacterium]MCL5879465.1 ABC transporter permease [Deltaproteobacteria bacterium]MDA8304479.1 ABC transporter permease subunit [Deltaproteobacteria bacterium]